MRALLLVSVLALAACTSPQDRAKRDLYLRAEVVRVCPDKVRVYRDPVTHRLLLLDFGGPDWFAADVTPETACAGDRH